jgi:hypothetical protein
MQRMGPHPQTLCLAQPAMDQSGLGPCSRGPVPAGKPIPGRLSRGSQPPGPSCPLPPCSGRAYPLHPYLNQASLLSRLSAP